MTCHRCGQRHAIYEDWAQCLAAYVGIKYNPDETRDTPAIITINEVLDLDDLSENAWTVALHEVTAEKRNA